MYNKTGLAVCVYIDFLEGIDLLRTSTNGLFIMNVPEILYRVQNMKNEVVCVGITLIKGKKCNRQELIDTMMYCFNSYRNTHPEFAPFIRFYVNIEDTRYILDASIEMTYVNYLMKLAKSL